jgi:hypothetical protein
LDVAAFSSLFLFHIGPNFTCEMLFEERVAVFIEFGEIYDGDAGWRWACHFNAMLF